MARKKKGRKDAISGTSFLPSFQEGFTRKIGNDGRKYCFQCLDSTWSRRKIRESVISLQPRAMCNLITLNTVETVICKLNKRLTGKREFRLSIFQTSFVGVESLQPLKPYYPPSRKIKLFATEASFCGGKNSLSLGQVPMGTRVSMNGK